jgi:hypothetical protein
MNSIAQGFRALLAMKTSEPSFLFLKLFFSPTHVPTFPKTRKIFYIFLQLCNILATSIYRCRTVESPAPHLLPLPQLPFRHLQLRPRDLQIRPKALHFPLPRLRHLVVRFLILLRLHRFRLPLPLCIPPLLRSRNFGAWWPRPDEMPCNSSNKKNKNKNWNWTYGLHSNFAPTSSLSATPPSR